MRGLLRQAADREQPSSCPVWDGAAPEKSLRPWLRAQLYWVSKTRSGVNSWGQKLYEALRADSLPRLLAETVDDTVVLSEFCYEAIMRKLLSKYAPYLEAVLGRAIEDAFFKGGREQHELFASYVARREVSLTELELQLGTPIDPRVSGYLLMRGAHMTQSQKEQV